MGWTRQSGSGTPRRERRGVTLESHSGSVYSVIFSLDGQLVASASEHTDEHEQPSGSAESSGQVPGGERDASTSTRAEGDGAGQRVSFHSDGHELAGSSCKAQS